tara:strand:- start:2911 stop:3489 length:579 start_codon:yes stop_codon:yes gene_type:complete
MRKLLTVLFVASLSINANSQDFEKGGNYVSFGYGLDPFGFPPTIGASYKRTSIGPILGFYERGITDILGIGRIGVGGGLGYSIYNQKYTDFFGESVYRRTRLSIIAKAAYHFEFDVEKMDVYAGVGASVNIYNDVDKYYSAFGILQESKSSSLGVREYVFVGIRYYFTSNFGVYAEAGYGLSALNGGIVFSF